MKEKKKNHNDNYGNLKQKYYSDIFIAISVTDQQQTQTQKQMLKPHTSRQEEEKKEGAQLHK